MLEGGLAEAKSSVIDLPDVDETTLRALLEYLYCEGQGALDDPDLVCHVLKVAHRFEVVGLVAVCTARLEATLTVENAVERFMLADELGIAGLKKVCARYLAQPDRLAEAQGTEPWKRLLASRPHLAGEVLLAVAPPKPTGRKKRPAPEPEVDYSTMSVGDLRAECTRRGLATGGAKAVLLTRLRDAA